MKTYRLCLPVWHSAGVKITYSLSESDVIFYDAFCVSVFSSSDATAQQRMGGFSPNLHQQTSQCFCQWWYPHENRSSKKIFGGSKRPFLERKFTLRRLWTDSRCTETTRNSGKTKTTGITTISRLPSHTSLAQFGSGEFDL